MRSSVTDPFNTTEQYIIDVIPLVHPLRQKQNGLPFRRRQFHYSDVIMGTIAFQITSPTIVYSTVYSGADQRKHQSSASLAFVRGIYRDRWIQMASNEENVSIWWRHHVKCISLNENFRILNNISLKCVPSGLIDTMEPLVQIVTCRRTGDQLLSEVMLVCCTDAYMRHSALRVNKFR